MRVGWVLLAAGLAVGQLEAAGVRVLAVGVGACALVVAQAEGLIPHLGGELRVLEGPVADEGGFTVEAGGRGGIGGLDRGGGCGGGRGRRHA